MTKTSIHSDFYISEPTAALTDLIPAGEVVRNTRNGVYVMLTAAGEARVSIDGRDSVLSQGSIVVLFPFHIISCDGDRVSENFRFEYLYFDFDFMSDFPLMLPPEESEQFGVDSLYRADNECYEILKRSFDTIREYYALQEHPSRIGVVKAQLFTLISDLLFLCSNSAKSVRASRGEVLTDGFFRLLHRNYKSERALAFYAAELCITTKYLSKVISRTTGQTVYFWIEEFSVKEAKLLLRSTQATVTEIAEQLNFPNSSFFAKFFRRHTGLTPTEFRRTM